MPAASDEKLAEKIEGLARNLADFRVEVAERFEKVTERFGVLGKEVEGFRAAVETELTIIRRLNLSVVGDSSPTPGGRDRADDHPPAGDLASGWRVRPDRGADHRGRLDRMVRLRGRRRGQAAEPAPGQDRKPAGRRE